MNISRINPSDLDQSIRGWISPEGAIWTGKDSHDGIANSLYTEYNEEVGIGWIRFLAYREQEFAIAFDWMGRLYSPDSEQVVRNIAKQITYPYDVVYCDYGDMRYQHWKGSLDDLIKFGPRSRKTRFESKLEKALRAL